VSAASNAAPAKPVPATPPAQHKLFDQYCVTRHDDEQKTANLSLEKLDLATVGDHSESWERWCGSFAPD
jgi:hypothetical protein